MAVLSNYSLFSALVLSLIYASSVLSYLLVSLALLTLSIGGVLVAKDSAPSCCKWIASVLIGLPVTYSFLDLVSLGNWFPPGIFHMHLAVAAAIASTGLALAFNNARSYL